MCSSPNCRKARELGLPLELVPVDFGRAKDVEYLAKNPTGKVPTLVDDDGLVIWESAAWSARGPGLPGLKLHDCGYRLGVWL